MYFETCPLNAPTELPSWLPEQTQRYLAHTVGGVSIREIARQAECHPSTVLRQIRRQEQARDDPLVDDLMNTLSSPSINQSLIARVPTDQTLFKDAPTMADMSQKFTPIDEGTLAREAKRILRRLCETDAVLVVSHDMDKAVVFRQPDGGTPTRTAVVPRPVAQAFAVKDWIACFAVGKVTRYRITEAGRAALKRFLSEDLRRKSEARGMAEAPSPFLSQHVEWGEKVSPDTAEKLRINLAESPLGSLARKKDKDGKAFLSVDLVLAGERLREDFEAAQMGPRVGQNWERFLTAGDRGTMGPSGPAEGPMNARARVSEALRALGPGLGDVVLRVCCFLEGLETAEKRMGWSARSGKIVLRIALQRLHVHYSGLHS